MILANGTVIITDAFPPDRLSQGMGVYIGTLSVAQLAGPTLGGLIAETGRLAVDLLDERARRAGRAGLGRAHLRRTPRGRREPSTRWAT